MAKEIARRNRFSNSYRVEFPDFPSFDQTPIEVKIHQQMGHHDVVELIFPYYDRFYLEVFATGTPVKMLWSNGTNKQWFFGYLTTASIASKREFKRNTKITCVGATYPLKERGGSIWTNKSASQIVEEVAKTFKLKALVTESKVRFSQQSMVGHTYWQKLNELARRVGYALHSVNTTIYFKPIDEMINEFSTSIPYLEFADGWYNEPGDAPLLEYFKPTVGDFVETGVHKKTTKILSGVNPITGKVYKKSINPNSTGNSIRNKNKEPLFIENDALSVMESDEMANHLATGRASLGRLNIPAKGIALGDPRISPWRTVEIAGTGAGTDGFWLVDSATHTLTSLGVYMVEFTCMTDGTGYNKSAKITAEGQSNVRNIKQEVISGLVTPTKTVLSGKTSGLRETDVGFKVSPRRWVGK